MKTLHFSVSKMINFFNNPKTYDLKLILKDNSIVYVYKSILSMNSPVFQRMIYGEDNEAKQANLDTIEIKDCEPKHIMKLLEMIYTTTSTINERSQPKRFIDTIPEGIELVELALQYEINALLGDMLLQMSTLIYLDQKSNGLLELIYFIKGIESKLEKYSGEICSKMIGTIDGVLYTTTQRVKNHVGVKSIEFYRNGYKNKDEDEPIQGLLEYDIRTIFNIVDVIDIETLEWIATRCTKHDPTMLYFAVLWIHNRSIKLSFTEDIISRLKQILLGMNYTKNICEVPSYYKVLSGLPKEIKKLLKNITLGVLINKEEYGNEYTPKIYKRHMEVITENFKRQKRYQLDKDDI
jgi:hypothetical protein